MYNHPFFFIVGRGRSGTDLLATILDAHPEIAIPPEALFILNLKAKYNRLHKWSLRQKKKFIRDLWREDRIRKWWKLNKTDIEKIMLNTSSAVTFPALCKMIYCAEAVKRGKNRISVLGDKNPTYALFPEKLIKIFPESKFIHIIRDYRDNILSFKNVGFDLKSAAGLAERWKYYNRRLYRFSLKYPESVILVRFEELITAPEKIIKKLCSFLKVPYKNKMLAFHTHVQKRDQWQQKLNQPIDRSQVQKWKNKMPPKDKAAADAVCRQTAALFYNKPEGRAAPFFSMSFFFNRLAGKLSNWAEKNFFYIPLKIRTLILKIYRQKTGTYTDR